MAVSQDDHAPEQAPVHGSDAPAGSTNRASARRHPTRKPVTSSPPGAAQGTDVGQALEQHITQAIQPALDEFRQRMEELSAQVVARPRRGADQADPGQEAPQEPDVQAPTAPTPPPQVLEPSAASKAAPPQREGEPAQESQPQQEPPTPVQLIQHVKERPLGGVLTSAVQTVGRSSAQWLQSLLVAGLGALLAESAHTAIQQRAEQGFHTLLQKAFEAAPADFANQELREKVERTLQLILREALDAVFAEGVRASVQQGGQHTLQQALHGDFGGALRTVEEMPQAMLTALIAVLRRHQQTLLRLLLALVLFEVGSALGNSEKAK